MHRSASDGFDDDITTDHLLVVGGRNHAAGAARSPRDAAAAAAAAATSSTRYMPPAADSAAGRSAVDPTRSSSVRFLDTKSAPADGWGGGPGPGAGAAAPPRHASYVRVAPEAAAAPVAVKRAKPTPLSSRMRGKTDPNLLLPARRAAAAAAASVAGPPRGAGACATRFGWLAGWLTGIAPELLDFAMKPWRRRRVAFRAADVLLNVLPRGVGQVYFMDNPATGVIMLLAVGLVSPPSYSALAIIGLASQSWGASFLRLNPVAIRNGLFGFSGTLLGMGAATFLATDTWPRFAAVALAVALFGVITACITQALGHTLVAVHKVPGFTLPFNISTSILLACAAHVQSDRIVLAPGLAAALPAPFAPPAPDPRDVAWAAWGALDVLVATLRGVSQVLLVADARAGAAIALGMALCSPISAAAGVAGAAIGVLTAFAFGADPAEAYAGLWGYNAVLGTIAICGMFFVLSPRVLALSALNAAFCAALGGAMKLQFAAMGIPTLTFPFCFASIAVCLVRAFQPVALASVTTPEEHLSRVRASTARLRTRGRRGLATLGAVYVAFLRYTDEVLRTITALGDAVAAVDRPLKALIALPDAAAAPQGGGGGGGARGLVAARAAVRRGFIMPWADVTALIASRRAEEGASSAGGCTPRTAGSVLGDAARRVAVDGISFAELVADAPTLSPRERRMIVSALLGRASFRTMVAGAVAARTAKVAQTGRGVWQAPQGLHMA